MIIVLPHLGHLSSFLAARYNSALKPVQISIASSGFQLIFSPQPSFLLSPNYSHVQVENIHHQKSLRKAVLSGWYLGKLITTMEVLAYDG